VEDIKMKCELCGKECIRTSVVKRCPECLLAPVVVKEPEVVKPEVVKVAVEVPVVKPEPEKKVEEIPAKAPVKKAAKKK